MTSLRSSGGGNRVCERGDSPWAPSGGGTRFGRELWVEMKHRPLNSGAKPTVLGLSNFNKLSMICVRDALVGELPPSPDLQHVDTVSQATIT